MLGLGATLCVGCTGVAQTPTAAEQLDWAKSAGGGGPDGATGIATDRYGNSYVTGLFSRTATFGAGEANQTELTAASFGLFLAKYAPDGALLWARSAGDFAEGFAIAADRRSNSYISGFFSGTATFGAGEANETELNAEDPEVFVAKHAPDGTLLWARSDGGEGRQEGLGIAADRGGNSFVAGSYFGTATFAAGKPNQTELASANGLNDNPDGFVAKYAPDGTLEWAKSIDGTHYAFGSSIATDRLGNSYVAGAFSGSATFGAGEASETVLASAGGFGDPDGFVAKYAPDGTLLWAKSAGGSGSDGADGSATDARGNVYVSGFFFGTATFGAGEPNQTELSAVGFIDLFVAKYAPDGTLLWAKSAGGADTDRGIDVATDAGGNSYVTGWFLGNATFGADESNQTELTAVGPPEGFGGAQANATRLSSPAGGSERPGIAMDHPGKSYIDRWYLGGAASGAGEAIRAEATASGSIDVFVAKYAPDGTLLWARGDGGGTFDQGSGIATDRRGNSYVTGAFSTTATFGADGANETEVIAAGDPSDEYVDIFVARYRADGEP
jgi:hypothetical protein